MDIALQRLETLDRLAEADEIFQVWKKSRDSFADDSRAYADSQPMEIRNMLWGYEAAGEMMLQRKLLLACENMCFAAREEK